MKRLLFLMLTLSTGALWAQPVPGASENVPFIVTFGKQADPSWGDDDHSQIFFFVIPKEYTRAFYIRVFDPDTGGEHDEKRGNFNTTMTFTVYGGKGSVSERDARKVDPVGLYAKGTVVHEETFGASSEHDNSWVAFGPFNPKEGEYNEKYGGYVFKVITTGNDGDDGNLYRYYLSTDEDNNRDVEGGNAFTFEYSFRVHDDPNQVAHIYPYADELVTSVKQSNYDWDNDGYIRMITAVRKGDLMKVSGDGTWMSGEHILEDEERNASMNIQLIKRKERPIKSNNVVFYVTNQYGEYLPFYAVPIGGIPKVQVKPGVRSKR